MSVKIRLTRMGTHKRPYYRVVAADSRMPRDGRFLDILGLYDPLKVTGGVQLEEEKIMAWIKKGATPSDTAKQLLRKAGILDKIAVAAQAS